MNESPGATPSQGTAAGRLLVCERGGQWAGALRRELARSGVEVGETRSLAECWDALAASPASFLVVELARAGAEDLLGRMARRERDFPLARVAVVADRSLAHWQWLLREAGAVHFTCWPRQLGVVAELACRHLAGVPAPPQRLTDRIWAGLPWGKELSA
jgi:hypothetical protein